MHRLTVIAYLSFTAPGMWAGVALAVFPVLAHLLSRYARRRRVFPSLLLLQPSVAEQARLAKWRRRLLLGLRCLFIAALAAAFARPVWRADRLDAAAASQQNAAVLLVDASASMHVADRGASRSELAKAAGQRILGDLRRGTDVANVIFVASTPRPVFDELSPNLPALQDELRRHSVTEESADVLAALDLAGRTLRDFHGTRRLVILSDLQLSGWAPLLVEQRGDRLPPGTQVTVVDLNVTAPPNVSLHLPRTDPAQPLLGQHVNLTAQMENHDERTRHVSVTAQVDGEPLPAVEIALAGRQRRDVAFEMRWDTARVHEIMFQLDRDAFPLDDQCYLIAQSRSALPVAIISDDDHQRADSADYFLARALAPYGDERDRFVVRRLTSRELPAAELDSYTVVFVGYLGLLERPAAERLLQYVEQGGACVVFCGQGPVKRNLLTLDALLSAGCLPWVPRERVDLFAQRRSERIAAGNWRARLLHDFDLTSQLALGAVRFGSIWRAQHVRAEAEVLLSFADGTPALAVRPVGQGQVVLANFSPDSESSDLGKHGAFVALMQILAQNLRPEPASAKPHFVGQPWTYYHERPLAANELTLLNPDGRQLTPTLEADGDTTQVLITSIDRAGIYRAAHGQRPLARLAVNIDPSESDPRFVAAAAVRQKLQPFNDADAQIVSMADWRKPIDLQGRPLWGWMILIAMAALATELGLLGWWRR